MSSDDPNVIRAGEVASVPAGQKKLDEELSRKKANENVHGGVLASRNNSLSKDMIGKLTAGAASKSILKTKDKLEKGDQAALKTVESALDRLKRAKSGVGSTEAANAMDAFFESLNALMAYYEASGQHSKGFGLVMQSIGKALNAGLPEPMVKKLDAFKQTVSDSYNENVYNVGAQEEMGDELDASEKEDTPESSTNTGP